MTPFSDWLAQTAFSTGLSGIPWAVPLLQSIHILAIGIVFSSVAMLDLRLAGLIGRETSLRDTAQRFLPWIWVALAVLLGTGLLQIMAEPARELLNWIFWTKMGLVVAATATTALVGRTLEEGRFRDLAAGKRRKVRIGAGVSLVLWIVVITCGRWIAYAGAPAS